MRIASLRLHWSVPSREAALDDSEDGSKRAMDLWGYVQETSAADAFLLAVSTEEENLALKSWNGSRHEVFFVAAPETASGLNSEVLRCRHYPGIPVKGRKELNGRESFFDCSKAERMLGWIHRD